MASIDLKKVYRDGYSAGDDPAMVDIPPRPYLMIDGTGDPNTSRAYRDAVATLYPLAYGLRKAIKDATGDAYTVMPLEGLWWVEDMSRFSVDDKSDWQWIAMILQPDVVTPGLADEVIPRVTARKALPSAARLEMFGDGPAAQILHRGAYAGEAPTIGRLHAFIEAQGHRRVGKHHEIYLTDPRTSAPDRNRTIIRQPVGSSTPAHPAKLD